MANDKNSPLNLEEAHKFIVALGAMIATGASREFLNPREAVMMAVPAGEELGLRENKNTRERDLIAVAFQPGLESQGPTNIAIYERLNNQIRINPRCSAWYSFNPHFAMIASHENDIGYGYGDSRLLRFGSIDRENFDMHLELARTHLCRAAEAVNGALPSPFKYH